MNKNLAIIGAKSGKLPKSILSLLNIMQEFETIKLIQSWDIIRQWSRKIDKLPVHSVVSDKELAELYLDVRTIKIPKSWTNAKCRHFSLEQAANGIYWTGAVERLVAVMIKQNPKGKAFTLVAGDSHNAVPHDTAEAKRKRPILAETISIALLELERAIQEELRSCKFVMIESEKAVFWEKKDLFGMPVWHASSCEMRREIKAAANCLAVELNTGAAFHCLRASELGMRMLAIHLNVIVFFRNKGKVQIGINEADWGELITGIVKKIDAEKLLDPAQRTIKNGFKEYARLAGQFDRMKEDRNNVMHTQGSVSEPDALATMLRAKDFLKELVKRKVPLK